MIALGGFLGALARYELGLAWPPGPGDFPWATFTINTSGAFLLGLALTILLETFRPTRWARPFVCTGVLGAWTTMSTLGVESDLLIRDGRTTVAVSYVAATVLAGVAVAWLGITTARFADARWAAWRSR